jgi:chromatin remodeling complex protein RSC6
MSDTQEIRQRCARNKASATANMALAAAELEAAISKMVRDTLQITSECAQTIVESSRKKRKFDRDTNQNKEDKDKDSEDEDSEDEGDEKEYVIEQ